VDFSGCAVADRAVWLAFQDGSGSWTKVTGVSDVYTFSITSGTGGLAYVRLGGSVSEVQVQYMTQSEFTAGTLSFCGPAPTLKTVNGTAAGIGGTEVALISLGGGTVFSGAGAFQISGVKNGTHDLVGFRRDFTGPGSERALIRRDQNIADNGSLGTVDFGGVESFAPASETITIGGLVGGETLNRSIDYHVGATCEAAPLQTFAATTASFTGFGIPAGQQRASDYHSVFIVALTGGNAAQTVTEYFHTWAARTVTLGAALSAPTITSLGGPYKRLQAVYTLPADYQTATGFNYVSGDKLINLTATFGYLGGGAVTLALADYSGLAGWDNSWAPASASPVSWNVFGSGSNFSGSVCSENARTRSVERSGTF